MFEKFTERARKVMNLARQEAQRLKQEFIGTEHILLGIIRDDGGVAAKALKVTKISGQQIEAEIMKLVHVPAEGPDVMGQLPFSPRAKRVIELASEAASQLGHDVVGTEHLLLGLVKEDDGIAAQVLKNAGAKLDELRDTVLSVLGADVPVMTSAEHSRKDPPTGLHRIDFSVSGKRDAVIGQLEAIVNMLKLEGDVDRLFADLKIKAYRPGDLPDRDQP